MPWSGTSITITKNLSLFNPQPRYLPPALGAAAPVGLEAGRLPQEFCGPALQGSAFELEF